MTEFADIIAQLRTHRAEAMARVEALDNAINALLQAADRQVDRQTREQRVGESDSAPRRRAPRGRGVKQHVIDLVRSSSRDWDAHEVLRELGRQGTPMDVDDPINAIRSALSRGTKAGQLVRTATGRYAGAPSQNGEVTTHLPEELEEPAPAPNG